MEETVTGFLPVYQSDANILILGTMPSVQSRKNAFYYSHPQNKFWRVLSAVFEEEIKDTIEDKKHFLYQHHIALWDVLKTCSIVGSSDAHIKNPVVNELDLLIRETKIQYVFTTGKKAYQLYQTYCYPKTKIEAIYLPSTSPANIGNYAFLDLVGAYQLIKEKKVLLK